MASLRSSCRSLTTQPIASSSRLAPLPIQYQSRCFSSSQPSQAPPAFNPTKRGLPLENEVEEELNDGFQGITDAIAPNLQRPNASRLTSAVAGNSVGPQLRIFRPGQFYNPSDLLKDTIFQKDKPRPRPPLLGPGAKEAKQMDPFHILGLNPLNESTNPELVKGYITDMGKIKTRAETGLTWKNQRRIGKMVRRARAMGLISQWTNKTDYY